MSTELRVDTSVLHHASRSIEMLFEDTTAQLNAIDAVISDSSTAWPRMAGAAFAQVMDSFADQRAALHTQLADIAGELAANATRYGHRDHETAAVLEPTTRSTLDIE